MCRFALLFALLYLIQETPPSLSLPIDLPPGEQSWEQMWLNQEVRMVNASNFDDIPAAVWSLPRPQLSNCLTTKQRGVLKNCIDEQLAKNSRMTMGEEKSSEESSRLMQPKHPHYAPFIISECVLLKTGARDNKTEDINMASLVTGFITASSLPEQQKSKAEKDLESCFKADWTLPTPPPDHHPRLNKTMPEDKMQRMNNNKKAMICSMKALIKNGCGDVTKPNAALTMTESIKTQLAAMQESESNGTTTNDGALESESPITTGDGVTAKAARMMMLQAGWR